VKTIPTSVGDARTDAEREEGLGMTEPKYEEQFIAFIDFPGFSEASTKSDEATRSKILSLLLALAALRGEFDLQSKRQEMSKITLINPAISTFPDHIVISFPLEALGSDAATIVFQSLTLLLISLAVEALRSGFLIRGGATIGNLYHAKGVVFGEALIDAVQIESGAAMYPRVVLSSHITSRPKWMEHHQEWVAKDIDGLYYFDYFKMLLPHSGPPGEHNNIFRKTWFDEAVAVIDKNRTEHNAAGKLKELAKWTWFARHFREGLEKLSPQQLQDWGVSLTSIP
jgi:hypothetical protein